MWSRAAEAEKAAAEAKRLVRDPEEWDTAEQGKSTWQVEHNSLLVCDFPVRNMISDALQPMSMH